MRRSSGTPYRSGGIGFGLECCKRSRAGEIHASLSCEYNFWSLELDVMLDLLVSLLMAILIKVAGVVDLRVLLYILMSCIPTTNPYYRSSKQRTLSYMVVQDF